MATTREVVSELLAARGVTLTEAAMGQTFAQLGLDSLHVVEVQLEIEQLLGVELGEGDHVEKAFHTLTVADFVTLVDARRTAG